MSRPRSTQLDGISGEKPQREITATSVEQTEVRGRVQTLLSPAFFESVYRGQLIGRRDRLLPVPLVALLLTCFCWGGFDSFAEVLAALREGLLVGVPLVRVTDQAFYSSLKRRGHAYFLHLLQQVTVRVKSATPRRREWVQALAPWAKGIVAFDDTTLDALARRTPELQAKAKGATGTLGGRVSAVLDLTTGLMAEVSYDADSKTNEKVHFYPLLERLSEGVLMVMDLGYFAFPLFDRITREGKYFITRMQKKATYEVLQVLVELPLYRDRIVYLGANRSDRAEYPVRLVELFLEGKWWRYVTNQMDPKKLPAEAVWRLYLERWKIEMAFFALKRALGLVNLRASNLNGVLAQVWATLTVFQVLQNLRLEVAAAQGLGADDVSWQRMTKRIALYTKVPEPKPPLNEWLKTRERLKKEGQRKRRATDLPEDVLGDCQRGAEQLPSLETFPPRRARQGKPVKKRKVTLIPGTLSPGPDSSSP